MSDEIRALKSEIALVKLQFSERVNQLEQRLDSLSAHEHPEPELSTPEQLHSNKKFTHVDITFDRTYSEANTEPEKPDPRNLPDHIPESAEQTLVQR